MTYTCTCCGKLLDEWPALAWDSPTSYAVLPENLKAQIAELSSDFCVVRHPDQTDRFIRATLAIKVIDDCRELNYGIWVSLSEISFDNYSDNFGNPEHEAQYFGWLSNDIPEYEIASIPTTVITQLDNMRPEIVPHENFDHQLVRDYYHGITKTEAEKRISAMLNKANEAPHSLGSQKPWWKFW